ncbi:MAG: hypothetical protein IJJ33_18090 [Victivallales bacterium]|nr:hypothetical protein [Victivallales bacterium]MBQ6473904.1 hypothetical protein [Victivallales bacterium]
MKTTHRHHNLLLLVLLIALPLFTTPLIANNQEDAKKAQELQNTEDVAEGKLALNGPTSDTWLIAAWEFVRDNTVKCWTWLSTHVHDVLTEDFVVQDMKISAAIVLLVVLTTMTLSGAWAASIAQSRRHPRIKFFFYGFVTFFVGPYKMLLNLDIKGEKEALERLANEAAAKRAAAEERALKEREAQIAMGEQPPAVSETGVVWNENYFNSIQRKADGTPDGPWEVTYNGVHVKVLEILEVLPTVVAVRLVNQEGHEMRGRIPFAKIEQWDRSPLE